MTAPAKIVTKKNILPGRNSKGLPTNQVDRSAIPASDHWCIKNKVPLNLSKEEKLNHSRRR